MKMDYGKLVNVNWNNQLPMGDNIKNSIKNETYSLAKEFCLE